MTNKNYTALVHDSGKIHFVGTDNECLATLQKVQSSSWEHALKYEGYSLVPVSVEAITVEEIRNLNTSLQKSYINKTIANREKEINMTVASFEIEKHGGLLVANVYNKHGNGYQVAINNYNGHKQGDITN